MSKVDLIAACTPSNGIGFKNRLPWHCKEDLELFKAKTLNSTLIVGRKTLETLPEMTHRAIICVSRTITEWSGEKNRSRTVVENSLEKALNSVEPGVRVVVIGGAEIYNEMFEKYPHHIRQFHLSVMKKEYECDSFIKLNKGEWSIRDSREYDDFIHYTLFYEKNGETDYLNILSDLMNTKVRMGRNGETRSQFLKTLTFDLEKDGFPLLTTKKMFSRGVKEELLFFLRGETDTTKLEKKRVNIWKGNTSAEFMKQYGKDLRPGLMGPMYGYQFRHFGAKYDNETGENLEDGFDQLRKTIELLKTDPNSRRHLMTSFNPAQAEEGVLYPCHSLMIQFYVRGDLLDMSAYNRSSDYFLGIPFNISSSAFFLCIMAKICGYRPGKMTMITGDSHIYCDGGHEDAVREQLSRFKYSFPVMEITKELNTVEDIESLKVEDFALSEYQCHSTIKATMIA